MKKKILMTILLLTTSVISFIGGTKINTNNSLNLNTVNGFEATEKGLMLYTNDGNGYYLEK